MPDIINLSSELKQPTEAELKTNAQTDVPSIPLPQEQQQLVKELFVELLMEQPLSAENFVSDRGAATRAILEETKSSNRLGQLQYEFNKAIRQLIALGVIETSLSTAEKVAPALNHLPIEKLADLFRRTAIVANAEEGTKIDTAKGQLQDFGVRFVATAMLMSCAHMALPTLFIHTLGVKMVLAYGAGFAAETASRKANELTTKTVVPVLSA